MKKRNLLLSVAAAGLCYVVLSSNASGGARNAGSDGTCASGTSNGCDGCHGASTSVAVTVELDSAGVPVTHYLPGHSYTLKVSGTNNTTSTLPKFGFQVVVVKSAGAGTTSAVAAGTFGTTLPTGVRHTTAATSSLPFDVLEQSSAQTATTGTGASGTTYVMGNLPWTAPAAGTGTLKLYGGINAVNGNGSSSGDKWNYATAVTITEASTVEVPTVCNNINVSAYPNPCVGNINLQLSNVETGNYNVSVINLNGVSVLNTTFAVNSNNQVLSINTADFAAGIYNVCVSNNNMTKVISVVKQ